MKSRLFSKISEKFGGLWSMINFLYLTIQMFFAEIKVTDDSSVGESHRRDPGQAPKKGTYAEQVGLLLVSEEKPVGRAFSVRTPEIRVVYIDNFVAAFIYFLQLCDQRLLTYQFKEGHLFCKVVYPDGSGQLLFTDKVTCRNRAVIARLKVEVPELKPKISEIRFEVKRKK